MRIEQMTHHPSKSWGHYRAFGMTIASDFPFRTPLTKADDVPKLTITSSNTSSPLAQLNDLQPVYTSPYRTDSGESLLYVYNQEDHDLLRFTRVADFYVWPNRILYTSLSQPRDYSSIEIYLLGIVSSFWLERIGVPVLHASAVVVENQAIAFLADNRGGKSTLAATFVKAGYPLLTDDTLPITRQNKVVMAQPSYPQMRLWPDQMRYLRESDQGLSQVHPRVSKLRVPIGADGAGHFCNESQPLRCLYLPSRRQPEDLQVAVEFIPLSPQDALIELIGFSFLPRVVAAVGLEVQRLGFLTQLVRQVPVRRIIYPSGPEHLPLVYQRILEDLRIA